MIRDVCNLLLNRYTNISFPGGSVDKESACNGGDPGLIPGWRRTPGERNVNPLHYSCLEDSITRGAGWATINGITSWTRLND